MLTPELDKMIDELEFKLEPIGHIQVLVKELESAAEGLFDDLMMKAEDKQQQNAAQYWLDRTLRQVSVFYKQIEGS